MAEFSEDVTGVLKFHHKARSSPLAFVTENTIAACHGLGTAICNLVPPSPPPLPEALPNQMPLAPSLLPLQDGVDNWRHKKWLKRWVEIKTIYWKQQWDTNPNSNSNNINNRSIQKDLHGKNSHWLSRTGVTLRHWAVVKGPTTPTAFSWLLTTPTFSDFLLPLVVCNNNPDMSKRLQAHPATYCQKINSVLAENQNTAQQVSEMVTNFQAQNQKVYYDM